MFVCLLSDHSTRYCHFNFSGDLLRSQTWSRAMAEKFKATTTFFFLRAGVFVVVETPVLQQSVTQQTIFPPLFLSFLPSRDNLLHLAHFEAIPPLTLGEAADESKLFLTEPSPPSQDKGKIVLNLINIRFQRKISR